MQLLGGLHRDAVLLHRGTSMTHALLESGASESARANADGPPTEDFFLE